MGYRSAQIFVQSRTLRLLRLVTKLYPVRDDCNGLPTGTTNATPDQIADNLLSASINENYPLAMELAKKQDALEKEYQDKAKQ